MADAAEKQESPRGSKTPTQWHEYWQAEMDASDKRLRKFTRQGNQIVRRFLDERNGQADAFSSRGDMTSRLNLFHKNVKTLLSMLYGQSPRIDVKREHQDPSDDDARVACLILERILEVDVRESGEDLASVYKACLQDRLLPGLGAARVRYTFGTTMVTALNPETGTAEEVPKLTYEDVPIDYVHWQDIKWGWCRTWKEMPWRAYRSYLQKTEVRDRFGKKIANNLDYKNQLPTGGDSSDDAVETDQKNNVQKAEIWEIWCKETRKVYWWSKGAPAILDMKDDPLKLDGFWPEPKPMMANATTTLMIPKADYTFAQDLYNEIDELQTRISIITRAIKVVGVYDKGAGDSVGRMLSEGTENDLIPVDSWAAFAEKGALKGVIDWFPVETIVGVLQTLQDVQSVKVSQLNEITGMSEIMRGGAGGQYTAAQSNQLAAKMGSIDVQAMQDEFARFCSDVEALKAEVIAKHYQPASIIQQSGAKFLTEVDQQRIPAAIELIKSPEIKWRVDIKPESIAMVDYAQLKSERTEFLTSMATFIQSAAGMAQQVPGSLPVMLEMLKWGMAGFKGGDYLEGIMDQAIDQAKQAPPPGQDDGKQQEGQVKLQIEQMKQQAAQQKAQAELQKIQAKAQADMQTLQAKLQGEIQKITVDAERDQTLEEMQSHNRFLEIARDLESELRQIQANMEADINVEKAQASFDIAAQQTEHQNTMTEINANQRGESNND